jgi:hypothetical protein
MASGIRSFRGLRPGVDVVVIDHRSVDEPELVGGELADAHVWVDLRREVLAFAHDLSPLAWGGANPVPSSGHR